MRRFLFAVVALAPGGLADAQSAKDLRFSSEVVSDEMATKTLGVVAANISMARDERGENLRPLTPEEASSPLLDIALVKEIMDVARASAAGQACGLDWTSRNYLKLMRRERGRGDRSTHQIAAISMVHGFTSTQFETGIPCSAEQRVGVEAFYTAKWPETH